MYQIKKAMFIGLCVWTTLPAHDQTSTNFFPTDTDHHIVNHKKFIPMLSPEVIHHRIQELGLHITRDYAGKTPLFIGALTGSFIFLADLVRATNLECCIDFIKISSYGNNLISKGSVTLEKNLKQPVTDRDVIIVEDIVDSGLSITFLYNLLLQQNPASLRVATLLYKPESAVVDFPIDYIGFNITSPFVIGYGLDYAQYGRNLPGIYQLVQEQ